VTGGGFVARPERFPIGSKILKAAPFEYRAPDTLEEALWLMAEHGEEARPLAGGQSLVPMMAFRLARPAVIVDLNRIDELAQIDASDDAVRVGAMVRERAAERSSAVATRVPLLARALPLIGHDAIRSRGTIGGSLAHGDAAAELPAVALATDARMTVRSEARGERDLAAADFFVSHYTNAMADDELLTGVTFPSASARYGVAFEEVTRRHGDFAIVGAVSMLQIADGTISDARLVLIGVADTPFRAARAEAALLGRAPGTCFDEAADLVRSDLDPPSDLHGSAAYRRHVAGVLVQRSLEKAAAQVAEHP
jgi:carbon-monoxide dehydrogenase medium subunit